MRKICAIFVLLVLALSASTAFAGDVPNLVGRWVGYILAMSQQGNQDQRGKAVYVFQAQSGDVFSGYMEASYPDGTKYSKPIAGSVGAGTDSEDLAVYFTEGVDGFVRAELALNWREMCIYHVEPGAKSWATVTDLRRTKR